VLSRGALGTLRLREGKAVVELQQSKGVCHAGLSGGR
jgi:hypothetical protein